MEITQHTSLKSYNTFGIDIKAAQVIEVTSIEDVLQLHEQGLFNEECRILGGGSNVLFTDDFDGTIILNRISEFTVLEENSAQVILRIGSGENWHQTVLKCVQNQWAGIENLSLIPGSVGAAPIQNIGAYGVEIKDVLKEVTYINLENGNAETRSKETCDFGYRDSIFKRALKGKVFITSVTLVLNKEPELHLDYGAIKDELAKLDKTTYTIKDVSDAVISIRQSKLPDPVELGNAGSFFKNPVISQELYNQVVKNHPEVKAYHAGDGQMKLAAGWLIEQCGWKGKQVGNTGCHAKQALVLVNYGQATGEEIWNHAQRVIESVHETFGVQLEPEVNVI